MNKAAAAGAGALASAKKWKQSEHRKRFHHNTRLSSVRDLLFSIVYLVFLLMIQSMQSSFQIDMKPAEPCWAKLSSVWEVWFVLVELHSLSSQVSSFTHEKAAAAFSYLLTDFNFNSTFLIIYYNTKIFSIGIILKNKNHNRYVLQKYCHSFKRTEYL